ncbi:MAG: extracellular solute-binding protein [Alphaproteobacteria bacterium]
MSLNRTLFLTALLALPFVSTGPVHAATSQPQTALAMTGAPLYPADFTHFDYTDADAPKGGFLKLGVLGSFDSLNPFIVRGQPPFGLGSGTMSLVYESLMTRGWDEPFTLYGLIAESVEVADDRSSIIFNINKEAHFSDGTPITADDVLFSFETLREKGRPNHRTFYKKVAFAQILSPTRIKFAFKRDGAKDGAGVIDREMPLIIGLMPIFPKHDWQDREFNETSLRPPVGSGPYKVTLVDVGRSITYERDPSYWGRDLPAMRGLYNFNKIRIDYYRDDNVSLQGFKAQQYDMRRESDPTKWATAYDFPAVTDGRVRLEHLEHHRTEPAYGFIFNTRHALFADPALRAALEYSFDFTWVNKNLFHGQYKRTTSFFPNSELAAPELPEGKELEILNAYRAPPPPVTPPPNPACATPHDKGHGKILNKDCAPPVAPVPAPAPAASLPDDIFTTPVTPPTAANEEEFRDSLLKAEAMLRDAGYKIEGDQLLTPKGAPVTFEIMLSDPGEEKVALHWVQALKRLGITAAIRTVDSAQYQSRIAGFDYDVTINKWASTLSPGNEQMYFWGSAAADQKGSKNFAGVKDPIVDAIAASIPNATTREDLVASTHALDRVLMRGHYMIPLYYMDADDIASWTKLHHPDTMSLYGNIMEAWWER